jgi:hypothetical protein
MIEKSDHTNSVDHHPGAAAQERLGAARGVLADVAQHSAQEVRAACRVVLDLGDDPDERAEARGLLNFLTSGRETRR